MEATSKTPKRAKKHPKEAVQSESDKEMAKRLQAEVNGGPRSRSQS